ncbi:unnamed protein product, partial [Rotaria magnacalcarata]
MVSSIITEMNSPTTQTKPVTISSIVTSSAHPSNVILETSILGTDTLTTLPSVTDPLIVTTIPVLDRTTFNISSGYPLMSDTTQYDVTSDDIPPSPSTISNWGQTSNLPLIPTSSTNSTTETTTIKESSTDENASKTINTTY